MEAAVQSPVVSAKAFHDEGCPLWNDADAVVWRRSPGGGVGRLKGAVPACRRAGKSLVRALLQHCRLRMLMLQQGTEDSMLAGTGACLQGKEVMDSQTCKADARRGERCVQRSLRYGEGSCILLRER